ncbi:MAG: ABC transporter permease [Thermodesulfobacteriota bacterium]
MIRLKPELKILVLRVLILSLFFLSWEIGGRSGVLDPFFFSRPSDIAKDLYGLFFSGKIYPHLAMTMKEMMTGLLLGLLSGIFVGILLGKSETFARALDPIVIGIYAIPKIAIAPLFILWFGLGIMAKIVIAWVVTFFLIFFNTYAGMKNVNQDIIDAVRTMGANEFKLMLKVSLPSCIPWILVGLRASLGSALVAAIVGEFIASDTGLGYLILEGSNLFRTSRVLSVVLILSAIVVTLDSALRLLETHFLRWRPRVQDYKG